MNLIEKIYNYPTKYKEGFINEEIENLLKEFPNIHKDKFNNALHGNTCMMKEGKIISYHCDILSAIRCGLENRDLTIWEWD